MCQVLQAVSTACQKGILEVLEVLEAYKKDVGFSLCAVPPFYCVSSYLWKSSEVEQIWNGSRSGMVKSKVWGSWLKLLHAVLEGVQTWSLSLGSEFRVWSTGGLGFSEQVTVPTLLSCLVFDNGQRALYHTSRVHMGMWEEVISCVFSTKAF